MLRSFHSRTDKVFHNYLFCYSSSTEPSLFSSCLFLATFSFPFHTRYRRNLAQCVISESGSLAGVNPCSTDIPQYTHLFCIQIIYIYSCEFPLLFCHENAATLLSQEGCVLLVDSASLNTSASLILITTYIGRLVDIYL